MKKHLLTIIAAAEAILIVALALVLFLPRGESKLSELSEKKQFEYIRSTGADWEEKYDVFVIETVKLYERNPYYESEDRYSIIYANLELAEKVKIAVNGYYGRSIEE